MSLTDKRLTQELVYGMIRWQATLDWLIARKLRRGNPKPPVALLLRLGLYQMFWLDRIPAHACVNETVELARRLGPGQAGFVNAVLREYAREKDATQQALNALKTTQPHLGYSHPQWLMEKWQMQWGLEPTRGLMEWNNQRPKTFARVNTLRITSAELQPMWRQEGVDYQSVQHDWFPEDLVFEIANHPPMSAWNSFQQGLFYVQDPSTLLAVQMLDPQPGEHILDACAAPGGKTSYLAQLTNNRVHLMAQDIDPVRLARVRDNLARLGVTCATTSRPSGTPCPELNAQYDGALVDAPCSNTGVIRRRVELRWRLQLREIYRLEAEQIALLRKIALQIKPGGRLIYSTCSLEPEENQGVVDKFLAQHPGWRVERRRELRPFEHGVDGAYVAVLRAPLTPIQPEPPQVKPLP